MHSRKILLAIAILLVAIVIAISTFSINLIESINDIENPHDKSVITYKIGKELKMEFSGISLGSLTILAVIQSVVDIFAILFLLFLAWRVLLVLEKLLNTCNHLLQQKISDQQDRKT